VPQYLEMSMTQFARNQEQMRHYLQNAFGFNPFQQFESMGKQNMAMFEQAMRMFNPFGAGQNPSNPPPHTNGSAEPKPAAPAATPADKGEAIDDLKRKLDELQNQIAELSKKS
jgi:polyhydroxyalkanoate synthesis regulator protein